MKNSKATTLKFESDFDFETANAQFKDDLTKQVVGMFVLEDLYFSGQHNVKYLHVLYALTSPLLQLKRWILGRPWTARAPRRRKLSEINTMTKLRASLTTSHQTISPGNYSTFAFCNIRGLSGFSHVNLHPQEDHVGGGEEVEHGNIRSAWPLLERQRFQGART